MAGERYKAIVDTLYDGVYIVDRQRRITYWNDGAERITGFSADHVIGRSCSDNLLRHIDHNGTELCLGRCPLAETLADGQVREAEVFLHHADGHRVPVLIRVTPLRDDDGQVVGGVEVFSDNAALLAARRRLDEVDPAALTDPLTGVGNRGFIEARIRTALVAAHRRDPALGILFIDIDRFKYINTRHGHDAGDRALKMVAATIRQSVRATDFVGRWGADEFVAAVLGVDRTRVIMIANKLRAAVERSAVALGRGESRVTVSIGATVAHPGETVEALIKRADDLLYQSRASGRDQVTFGE
jgi:diguanylate cyclase (GGDEF)-like protein/PAS domain S-box-containing protein